MKTIKNREQKKIKNTDTPNYNNNNKIEIEIKETSRIQSQQYALYFEKNKTKSENLLFKYIIMYQNNIKR